MINIYCFYLGKQIKPHSNSASVHVTVAKVIRDSIAVEINRTYSTAIKWTQNDIGYKRCTSIVPWTREYVRARTLYKTLFGMKKYRLIWTTSEQFEQICYSQSKEVQLTLELN